MDSECDAEAQRYVEVFEQAGAAVERTSSYASWAPDPGSRLLALMKQVYTGPFGTASAVAGLHVGLETGTVRTKYPGTDLISIGPTIQNAHSPNERVEVASVPRAYLLLVETLARIE